MSRRALVPILIAGLLIVGIWAYREYYTRRAMALRVENQYQRAFQELAYHLDSLDTEIAKVMVAESPRQRVQSLSNVWRHAYSSQENIGQLPLSTVSLTKTENFLGKLSTYTFTLARKVAAGQEISDAEWNTLKELQRQARFVNREVSKLRSDFARRRLRWANVQTATASASAARPKPGASRKPPSNPVVKSFEMMEDGMKRFPEPDFMGQLPPSKVSPKGLTGPEISSDAALEVARKFVGPQPLEGKVVRVTREIPTQPRAYRIEATPGGNLMRPGIRLDVTEKGGHVLWMLNERPIGRTRVSTSEAISAAERFLVSRGFADMRTILVERYGGIAMVTLAYVQDDVLIYPDQIKVRVALDNGEVVGFDGTSYITFHRPRPRIVPVLSLEEARKKVNPRLDIISERLVIMLDETFKERLCYEFRGRLEDEEFLVYIDAVTGEEVEVKKATARGPEVA